jgi:uncharacterized protein (DUF486 family)
MKFGAKVRIVLGYAKYCMRFFRHGKKKIAGGYWLLLLRDWDSAFRESVVKLPHNRIASLKYACAVVAQPCQDLFCVCATVAQP